MRIIAGQHRGTALTAVGKGDAGAHLRPTTDRVRESLFNVLQGGRVAAPLHGARVLDLFAGTGALGLEALSRGAAHATFVDKGRVAQRLIRANIDRLGRQDDCRLLTCAVDALPQADAPVTLIFVDPPYGAALGPPALARAQALGWVAPDAIAVLEDNSPQPAPPGFEVLDHRRYGDTWISFLQAAG